MTDANNCSIEMVIMADGVAAIQLKLNDERTVFLRLPLEKLIRHRDNCNIAIQVIAEQEQTTGRMN